MSTHPEQIEAMRELCTSLKDSPGIDSAHVDDWGRYGNFTVMVIPSEHTRSTSVRLRALVRKLLPSGAAIRQMFPPDAIREHRCGTGTRVVGYTHDFWTFDIDYQRYSPESNTFAPA